jgi:hypothetical protein
VTESIHILGEGGSVFKMDLPLHEAIQERLTKGYLKRVNPDGSAYVEPDPKPVKMPAKNASKAQWVGWAVAMGADPDDAEALTPTDLAELYGPQTIK